MNMDFQEGYCDGLAGAGVQVRMNGTATISPPVLDYSSGFIFGSLDRKAMLTRDPFAAWCEGLCDDTREGC